MSLNSLFHLKVYEFLKKNKFFFKNFFKVKNMRKFFFHGNRMPVEKNFHFYVKNVNPVSRHGNLENKKFYQSL